MATIRHPTIFFRYFFPERTEKRRRPWKRGKRVRDVARRVETGDSVDHSQDLRDCSDFRVPVRECRVVRLYELKGLY